MENRIIWILLGGTILTGVAALILISTIQQPLENSQFNKQAFDQQLWMHYHDKADDRDNPRGAMANDLRGRLMSMQTDRDGVLEFLGDPEVEFTREVFRYNLGMWSNNRTTRDTLDIYFDANGRIQRIEFSTL